MSRREATLILLAGFLLVLSATAMAPGLPVGIAAIGGCCVGFGGAVLVIKSGS